MLNKIINFVKTYIYNICIVKANLIDKYDQPNILNTKTFSTIILDTNKGTFVFTFKEDRRATKKIFRKFIVEINVPAGLSNDIISLNTKIFIAIKLIIMPVDYTLLTKILYNRYLKEAIKKFEK